MNYNHYATSSSKETRPEAGLTLQAFYDPFVYETLKSIVGSNVVIETTCGGVHGTIVGVKPDHVVLESHGKNFFVRICKIVWIMPIEE